MLCNDILLIYGLFLGVD